jgi:hypothetical protein
VPPYGKSLFNGYSACLLLKGVQRGSLGHVSQLLASATTQHSASHGNSMLPLEIVLVLIGVFIGRIWGRRTGLKHLGETEFHARWANVRKHRPW